MLKDNHKQQKVFILGTEGFPTGGARIEKLKLFGKALLDEKINVHFICNSWSRLNKGEIPNKGVLEGISYYYTSNLTCRPNLFITRRVIKLFGAINEVLFLLTHKCDAALVSVTSGHFFVLFKYWVISRIKGYKIFYPHHEVEDTLKGRNILRKINIYLFKKYTWRLVDGVFPISTYLEAKIRETNKYIPLLRIPAMVDFSVFEKEKQKTETEYFLYCGSIGYYDIIEFIIDSYELLPINGPELHLVCSGDKKLEAKLIERIEKSPKQQQIKLFGFLSYDDLIVKYLDAIALLIPLRNNIKDIARFPHKIGEYTASSNPIITCNVGDINLYFKNMENALVAEKFHKQEFASLMLYIISNPNSAVEIGRRGYIIGQNYFNYKVYGKSIKSFMGLNLKA